MNGATERATDWEQREETPTSPPRSAPEPAGQSSTTLLCSEIPLAQNWHLGFLSSAPATPIYLHFYHNSDVKSLKAVYTDSGSK